jgi:hypothetical protein
MPHTLTSYLGYRLHWRQRWLSVGQYLQRYYITQRIQFATAKKLVGYPGLGAIKLSGIFSKQKERDG